MAYGERRATVASVKEERRDSLDDVQVVEDGVMVPIVFPVRYRRMGCRTNS